MKAEILALTRQQYFDRPELSQSAFKVFLSSPELHRGYETGIFPRPEPTAAQRFGDKYDRHVLSGEPLCEVAEPDEIERLIPLARRGDDILFPPRDKLAKNGARSTNAYRDWAAKNADAHIVTEETHNDLERALSRAGGRGVVLVTPEDRRRIECMTERLGAAEDVLYGDDVEHQVAVVWENTFGVKCKALIDLRKQVEYIGDLKTAENASPRGFSRAAWNFGYGIQNLWYLDGFEAATGERPPFNFIVSQSSPGYVTRMYRLSEKFLKLAQDQIDRGMERYCECFESDDWRDECADELIEIDPPGYAYSESEWSL